MRLCGRASAAAALALTAGCGGEDPVKVLKHASQVTGRENTAQLILHATVEKDGRSVDITGQGVVSTHLGEQEGQISAQIFTHPAVYDMAVVLHHGTMWMSGTALPRLPGDKRWLKIDFGRLGGRNVSTPSGGGTSFTAALAYLAGVREADEVGSDTILGAKATHYRATIDVERASAAIHDPAVRTLFRLDSGGTKTLPVDVWVDGSGHVVRYKLKTRSAAGDTTETTLDLVSFGIPLVLGVPPRGKTFDGTAAAARQSSSGAPGA